MKKLIFLFAAIFIFISFRPGQPNEYGKWQMFYKIKHDDFVQVGEEKKIDISWKAYNVNEDDRKLYRPLYSYAPDSMYFLDLYSYGTILNKEKDGSVTWGGGDPESKVELVNTKDFSATTLIFFGTDGFPETAFWRGQSWFVVCGWTKNEKAEFVPTTWWYDLTKKTYTEWHNTTTFKTLDKRYCVDVKLAGAGYKERK